MQRSAIPQNSCPKNLVCSPTLCLGGLRRDALTQPLVSFSALLTIQDNMSIHTSSTCEPEVYGQSFAEYVLETWAQGFSLVPVFGTFLLDLDPHVLSSQLQWCDLLGRSFRRMMYHEQWAVARFFMI